MTPPLRVGPPRWGDADGPGVLVCSAASPSYASSPKKDQAQNLVRRHGVRHLRLVVEPARPPRPLRKNVPKSKSRLDQICFKLQRDIAILRREVTSLQALLRAGSLPKPATIDSEEVATREAAKRKRIEEREAANEEHAKFVAKQALIQPEKDRARTEWEAKEASRKREMNRVTDRYRAANPEKVKASVDRWRAANPGKAKAIAERWRAANPEKLKASMDRWRAANHEKVNQKRREKRAAQKQIQARPDLLDEVSP